MHEYDQDNKGRFPDETPVEIRYPRSKREEQGDREQWPWLPGTIVEQCGPDEWYVSGALIGILATFEPPAATCGRDPDASRLSYIPVIASATPPPMPARDGTT